MSIIDLRKKNRYPFGMWPDPECYGPELGKEMQEKAWELGKSAFEYFDGSEWTMKGLCEVFAYAGTYRLRATYQEEPEIEKCEIGVFNDRGKLCYRRHTHVEEFLWTAQSHHDVIGFECDGWIFGMAYKNKTTGNMAMMIPADQLHKYDVCDLAQGHVLFRRAK